MKLLVNLTALFIISIFAFLITGCGASTEVSSVKDYYEGKFDPGFLFGMSPDEIKLYADGITDSKARVTALKIWEQNFSQIENTQNFTMGKTIIVNQWYRDATVGVEGPQTKTWNLAKNEVFRDNLIPGNYLVWFDIGKGKQYVCESNGETRIKTVGYSTEYYHGEASSLVLRLRPDRY